MHLTLLESDRSFLHSAECAVVSIVAHVAVVWYAIAATAGGGGLPTDEREARVFFLLPPDRVDAPLRQSEIIQLGKLGSDLEGGAQLAPPGEGLRIGSARAYRSRRWGERSGARGDIPFGPPPSLPDTAFSVLEVDKIAERYESSAAPIYPRDLIVLGVEGLVQATYVVDSTGMVDTTTVEVMHSDDLRFTESVRTALGQMRFRPAVRAGKTVRQLVEQKFRFRIEPARQVVKQMS
jgi:hypothetical protein